MKLLRVLPTRRSHGQKIYWQYNFQYMLASDPFSPIFQYHIHTWIAQSQNIFSAYVIILGVIAIYLLSVKTLQENLHDTAIHVCWRDCVLR